MASVSGNGTSATYIVSCWRNDNGAGSIANIPVAAKGAATQGNAATAGGTGTAQPGAASGSTALPGQAPKAGAASPGVGGVQTATGTTASAAPALQGAAAASAPVSAQTASQDVVLPTWLAVLGIALAMGGYGFAGWRYLLRSRALRSRPGT